MEKRNKPLGRPPITKGRRTRKIDVRFSEEEYAAVLTLERLLGLKRTDIIRKRVLEVDLKLIFNTNALLASIDQVGLELSRSGNNINQLARYANILISQRILSPVLVNRYLKEMEKHSVLVESFGHELKKILRIMSGY